MEDRPPFKRKADFADTPTRKSAKMDTKAAGGAKMSFAARMMAKMGHVEGQGLGKTGEGILNPIEVKLRPQGAGVGAVKEKTEQAKAEARRAAESRGEQYEDSSEEERRASRKRKEDAVKAAKANRTGTPGGFTRPKTKFRTVAEIEASADGLEVPNVLKSLIDATGRETKLLTSTAGLMTPLPGTPGAETEAEKIAKRARRDLEGFVDSWNEITDRKKFVEAEQEQIRREMQEEDLENKKLQAVSDAMTSLMLLDLKKSRGPEEVRLTWEAVVDKLVIMQTEYRDSLALYDLQSAAVAAIHPLFKQEMLDWSPLDQPDHLVTYLSRLRPILGIDRTGSALTSLDGGLESTFRKSTTPYESLIYNLWLPRVRTTITNEWNPHEPTSLLALVEAWQDLLPPFIRYSIVNVQIVAKLSATVQAWNPRTSVKRASSATDKRRTAETSPHVWLFPWLPYLSDHHTDPRSSHGLLTDVKRKLRVVLDTWDLSLGLLPALSVWRQALGSELEHALLRHLLPRLARHLHDRLEVYPPDQDLTPLEDVLAWNDYFTPLVMAQLLLKEFFPKWLNTLHAWLTGEECNYEEVGEWFKWWKAQIPVPVSKMPEVQQQWGKGLEMLNAALDLVDQGLPVELPQPATTKVHLPTAPIKNSAASVSAEPVRKPAAHEEEEATFKDVVEDWCMENDLTLKPLREAHDTTGLPLFRISASADGKSGGAKVFIKGDLVMVQNRKDRSVWEPIMLGEGLIKRAEMR